jgi:teichuronic acid biosynthesis glycosyltransferase TuaG
VDKVSVIIPTWNRARTIGNAIQSVLKQSVPPIEILVCDDGSTDDTQSIVKEFENSRIRWLPGSRSGRPAVPRNRGVVASKGEWLAFLDSDDTWLPGKLERQLKAVSGEGCKASCTNALRYVQGKEKDGSLLSWRKNRIKFEDLVEENVVVCSSALVHRSLLNEAIGFPEETSLRALEDYALWLRISIQTDFVFIPEAEVIYWDDAESSLRANSEKVLVQRRRVLENLRRWGRDQKLTMRYRLKIEKAFFLNEVRMIMADSMEVISRLKRGFKL